MTQRSTLVPPPVHVRQLIFGYVVSQTVGTVARLAIPDHLADGPLDERQLATRTGADVDALGRLLQAAVSIDLLRVDDAGRFELTPSGALLRTGRETLRDFAIAFTGPSHWRPMERLREAVLTGRPQAHETLHRSVWSFLGDHPEDGAAFDGAMSALSAAHAEDVVEHFDVSPFSRIVDVGGGRGHLLARLLEANPAATGVLFDQPATADAAAATLAHRGVADRAEIAAGDFFVEVPSGGDLYVLKTVLHDWDDWDCLRILEQCHRAAEPGATLLIVERLVDEGADASVHCADLLMLSMLGGRERTREQFEAVLDASGFELQRVIRTPRMALIEARRV